MDEFPLSQGQAAGFLPPTSRVPSVLEDLPLLRSHTYRSEIPENCLPVGQSAFEQVLKGAPCALGVDEAGRGPVLGPLVYGVAICPVDQQPSLKEIGFADSKALTAQKRDALLEALKGNTNLAWATISISPQDISRGMTRRRPINLNAQSTQATVDLIAGFLEAGVDVTEIYVDTVGDPDKYKRVLSSMFPRHKHIQWTVCSKADVLFPIVGAASIAAKVTRDRWIEGWKYGEAGVGMSALAELNSGLELDDEGPTSVESPKKRSRAGSRSPRKKPRTSAAAQQVSFTSPRFWAKGSGYPGDPETKEYLLRTIDAVFGWPGIVRFSWQTAKDLMSEKVKVGTAAVKTRASSKSQKARGAEQVSQTSPAVETLAGPYGTRQPTLTRCHDIRWTDEPAQITNFFQKAAASAKGSSNAVPIDIGSVLKKARCGIAKDLGVISLGPGAF
ncbi:ribonuclease H-like protein [Tilletiaria anomala UBC 951]|uniref:Ribonuclease n=1 Tax=Tilletiaria anomala (strain ATCC 24038 / CBS 436.72 / UBC 951) TaxID=1037660 RepID=A0A066VWG0_TILAU|nr:ribonuclease H-like protein [Tilletiaria anomala UBC 951]KDN42845.1 ribonuclease H-like protein [Tilletiaria anomala UBC 951]